MMLMYLSLHENTPSQKAIAEHFGISPAAVTVTLKKLCDAAGRGQELPCGCLGWR
ncbi:MAG: MarR family transcriptional regulator [Oscillospiraceae bacterium]|nr:MarR family transcriptional regulator [Oscillospiraceae bacterium]